MAVSVEQAQLNYRAARSIVLQEMGYAVDTLPNELSDAKRIELADRISDYIVQHVDQFTPAQVQLARARVNSGVYGKPLEDDSFNWSTFGNEVVNNAGSIVTTAGNTIRNAIYLAVAVFIVVYFFPRITKAFKQ